MKRYVILSSYQGSVVYYCFTGRFYPHWTDTLEKATFFGDGEVDAALRDLRASDSLFAGNATAAPVELNVVLL